jgi:hypothetical protein
VITQGKGRQSFRRGPHFARSHHGCLIYSLSLHHHTSDATNQEQRWIQESNGLDMHRRRSQNLGTLLTDSDRVRSHGEGLGNGSMGIASKSRQATRHQPTVGKGRCGVRLPRTTRRVPAKQSFGGGFPAGLLRKLDSIYWAPKDSQIRASGSLLGTEHHCGLHTVPKPSPSHIA